MDKVAEVLAKIGEMKFDYCPEVKEDECFIGNVAFNYNDTEILAIPSMRLGNESYDIYGEFLPLLRPLIVKKGADYDTYNKIMDRRTEEWKRANPPKRR